MGLFSRNKNDISKGAVFNSSEGFAGILLAVIAADGVITPEETIDFYSAINKAKVLSNISQRDFKKMMDRLMKILKKQGVDALLSQSVAGMTPDLSKGCYAYACEMVYSDSIADPSELRLLDKIRQTLVISDEFANKCTRVFQAKANI